MNTKKTVQEFAPAKINLYLHVLGRRGDGYHNLDSLVAFASIGDLLDVTLSSQYSLEVTGPFATTLMAGTDEPNLVLTAADVVAHCVKEIPPGGHFNLIKNLPIASGIGGGSSDAAACVRALLKLHQQELSDVARQQIALAIGSDVSACLHAKAARMTGAGHMIESLKKFPKVFAVLVNPGVQISTAHIFQSLNLDKGEETDKQKCDLPHSFKSADELCQFLETTGNDLQPSALSQAPVIGSVISVLDQQKGCMLARMSGSGATCFGLFSEHSAAEHAATSVKQLHPDWWVQPCSLS